MNSTSPVIENTLEDIKEFEAYLNTLDRTEVDDPANDEKIHSKLTMANYKDKYPKQYPPFANLANIPEPGLGHASTDVLEVDEPVEIIKSTEVQEKVKKSRRRLGINWFGLNFTLIKSDSDRLKTQEAILGLTTDNVTFHFEEE